MPDREPDGPWPSPPESASLPGPPVPAMDVAAAMNKVLAAERAAQQAVESARAEAAAIVADARRRAREQLEQSERLARLVHGRTEKVAQARAEKLMLEAACPLPDDPEAAAARVRRAIERLAMRLTESRDG